MALAQGSIQLVSVGATSVSLLAPQATGGSGSVSYQYYRATSSGFTPGSQYEVGGDSLALNDSGLTPGTAYYYMIVATDAAMDTASSAQLTVQTSAASPNPNQFSQSPFLGMLDLRFNPDTVSVQFDPAGSGSLVAGQVVQFSTQSTQGQSLAGAGNGIPLVEPAGSSDAIPAGFVNYDIKSVAYAPGDRLEISLFGNVMYLYATEDIDRGEFVYSLPFGEDGGCNGGVAPITGSSGFPIAGWSLDTAAQGTLCRIFLQTPSAPYAVD